MAQALPPVLPVRLVSIAPLLLPPQVSALQAATEVPLEEPSRETALPALQETTVLPAQSTQPIAVLGHMSPAQEGQTQPLVLPVLLGSTALLQPPPQVSALQAATGAPLEEPNRETALPVLQETTALPAQSTQPTAVLGHMSPVQEELHLPPVLPVLQASTVPLLPRPQVSALQAATGAPLEEPSKETALHALQETTALPTLSILPIAVLGHMSPAQEGQPQPPVLPVLQVNTAPLLPPPQVSALQAATGAPLEGPSRETAPPVLLETTVLPAQSTPPIAMQGHMSPAQEELHLPPVLPAPLEIIVLSAQSTPPIAMQAHMSPAQEGQHNHPALPVLQASSVPWEPPPQVSALQAATGAPLEEPSRETAPPVPQETTAQQVLSIPPTAVLGPMSPVQEGQPQPPVLPALQASTVPLLPPPQVSALQAATGAPLEEPSRETALPVQKETTALPTLSILPIAVLEHMSPARAGQLQHPVLPALQASTVPLLPPPQVSAQQAATGAPQEGLSKETAQPALQETTVLPVQSTRSTAVQGHTSPALGAARLAPACHVHRLTTVLLLPPAPHSALPTPTPWGVPPSVPVVLVTPRVQWQASIAHASMGITNLGVLLVGGLQVFPRP